MVFRGFFTPKSLRWYFSVIERVFCNIQNLLINLAIYRFRTLFGGIWGVTKPRCTRDIDIVETCQVIGAHHGVVACNGSGGEEDSGNIEFSLRPLLVDLFMLKQKLHSSF